MLIWGFAQLAGTLAILWLPELPHPGLFFLAFPVALASLPHAGRRCLAAFWLGAALAAWQAGAVLEDRLSPMLEGQVVTVSGTIHGLVERKDRRQRFLFAPDAAHDIDGRPVRLPRRLRINLYDKLDIASGERWQWQLKVRRPRGFANPGGFDYERWLFAQRIGATGYVYRPETAVRIATASGEWRATIAARVAAIADGEAAGLLRGLATGDRTGISKDQWELLRKTGTAHLMAISGLHIGLVAGLGLLVGGYLRRRFRPSLDIHWPYLLAGLAATAYGALSGFTLPVRRALLGSGVVLLALGLRRQLVPGHAYGAALAGVLCLDPLAPLDVGFWLSFGAVAAILFLLAGRRPAGSKLRQAARVQAGLFLLLAPLLLAGFGQLPLVSPLANAIAIPVFAFLVVPGVMLSLLLLPWTDAAAAVFLLLDGVLARLQDLLAAMASLDPGFFSVTLPLPALLLAMVAALLLTLPRAIPGRWLGAWLLIPVFWLNQPVRVDGALAMHVLDVGQGLAVVVETTRHTLVYDTGPGFGDGDAGEMVVVPFLQARGRHPDTVVISHGHNDHAGGLDSLLARYPAVQRIGRARKRADLIDCAERHWQWDDVAFRMLYPAAEDEGSENDISCVLLIDTGEYRVLLTGDIEARAEARLLARMHDELRADVVIVPHHGSRTSSTPGFVTAVGARLAIAGAGFGNRWGFPRGDVVERWQRAGAEVFSSGEQGAITVVFTSGGLRVQRFREERRLWREAPPQAPGAGHPSRSIR